MLPLTIRQSATKFASDNCRGNEEVRSLLIEAYCKGATQVLEEHPNLDIGLATDDIVTNDTMPCIAQKDMFDSDNTSFDVFWRAYDKKVGRSKAEKLWNRLSAKDKRDCMAYVPEYVKAQDDKQYRKNPETFLRNRCWEDEIIYSDGGGYGRDNRRSSDEQERDFLAKSLQGLAASNKR